MADEISWRRNWKPEFETEAWKVIHVGCKIYWIKYYFEELLCSYKIAVTDCEGIWIEDVGNEVTFCERAKKLNPNIEAQSAYLIKHLSDCLTGLSGITFSAREPDTENDHFSLCLKSKLTAGIPFSWEFYCAPEQKQMMKDNLVLPLISMVGELQRRQKELCKILRRKDYEIQEYRNTGAVLPRKSFETQPFLQEDFVKRMTVSEGFLQVVENCAEKVCDEENQELYKQVMIKRKWIEFKNNPAHVDEGTFETIGNSQGTGSLSSIGNPRSSWDTKLPPSLFDETSPEKRSPMSSPSKSPNKKSPEKSSSQDTELNRRKNLHKRLNEEAEKKKSKKRKKLKI